MAISDGIVKAMVGLVPVRMGRTCTRGLILLLSIALLCLLKDAHAQDCEMNCKTENCNADGVCICRLPDPESVMAGDRFFEGGKFCDVEALMCDDTNSFWCESGGICNEVIQGENYTCTCQPGFAGKHCELAGALCGVGFCFNEGSCIEGISGNSCDCPAEWQGLPDCSLPTPVVQPPATSPISASGRERHGREWWIAAASVLGIVAGASCLGAFAYKWHKQRAENLSKSRFHELRQVQMSDGPDFYDDGEDDPFADTPKTQPK